MNKKASSESALAIGAVVCVVLLVGLMFGFDYVPAGNIGVKNKLGQVNPVPWGPGVEWTGFMTSTEKFSTRIQKVEYDASAASNDLQIVDTKIALNFKVNPTSTPEIYKTIGRNYQDVIISPVIQEAVKSSTARYTAESLVKERTQVKADITNYIMSKLESKGLIVTEVSITDFKFSDEFNAAIDRKQVAEQDALTAENKLKEMEFTSQSMKLQSEVIEIKKLDLEQLRIEVELEKARKWDGAMPKTLITSDSASNFLMQLPQ